MLDRLAPSGPLGVAVSGGGDSMALLSFAVPWARGRGRELRAVTVDHGLRPGSAAEAAFVSGHCARLGIPHQTLRAGPMASGNLSAAAREARYGLMAGWARDGNIPAVALGHTMDDQAETVLMRLARGSGAEGLSGMAPRRDALGVAWIRPIVGLRRAVLRTWLQEHGVGWIDDPTNEDPAYDRVKARTALAALEPLGITVEGLATTARILSRQRRVLARAAAELDAAAVTRGAYGEARIGLPPLRAAERDTALRVVAETLACVAGHGQRPRIRSLQPVVGALLGPSPGAATLGGCLVVPDLDGGSVLLCREPGAVAPHLPFRAPGAVWDGRWRVSFPPGLPGSWRVGALGKVGCELLGRAAREGRWQPPAPWLAAPRPVRETVPALFPADATDAPPAAVPAAEWTAEGAPAALAEVRTSLIAAPAATV